MPDAGRSVTDGQGSGAIVIVGPDAAASAVLTASRRTWCFLGRDDRIQSRLRVTCGADVPVGEALTGVAMRLKQPFLDWIARIGRRQPDPRLWWASAVASKSPLQTDLFFLVCYGEILSSWRAGGAPAQVIVVEDPWLLATVRGWFGGAAERPVAAAAALRRLGRRRRVAFVAREALRVIAARARLGRRLPRPVPRVLIFTWIEPRAFSAAPAFADPYTGRLATILADGGLAVARLTPIDVPRALWAPMRASAERFVALPAFAGIGDVLRAALAEFRLVADGEARIFLGRDHGLLLEREQLAENAGGAWGAHLLGHAAIGRLAERLRGTPLTVIYPFENQPHEKLLCLAWREAAPDVTLAGYVMAGIPSLLLSFFLGAGEAAFQPLPDTIVVNGPAGRDLLAAHGYPADRLVDGGAFRFEHLAALASGPRARVRPPQVLVPLPTVARYARELLGSLSEALRDPLVDPVSGEPVRCVVTFHVDLPRAAVAGTGQPLPASIELSDQSVGALLADSALCVFVPPTGSWREALIAGVPVLRYQPDTLDLDPVDALGGIGVPTCSRATLRDAMAGALRAAAPLSPEARARLLGRLYSPVRETVWLRLAGAPELATMKHPHE